MTALSAPTSHGAPDSVNVRHMALEMHQESNMFWVGFFVVLLGILSGLVMFA